MGRYDESKALAAEALALAREIGDLTQIASALVLLTFGMKPDEDARAIEASYEEINSIATTLGDDGLMARNLNNLAEWHRLCGSSADAAACYERSLALDSPPGEPGDYHRRPLQLRPLAAGPGRHGTRAQRFSAKRSRSRRRTTCAAWKSMCSRSAPPSPRCAPSPGARPGCTARRWRGCATAARSATASTRHSSRRCWPARALPSAAAAFDAAEHAGAALKREAALDELGAWLADFPDDL